MPSMPFVVREQEEETRDDLSHIPMLTTFIYSDRSLPESVGNYVIAEYRWVVR